MEKQEAGFRFNMFGRFTVFYDGQELRLDKSGTTKMMQLLAMLTYYQEGISRETLLRNLYGEKELADRNNNLRVTVFKLRKMLEQSGLPEGSYITVKNDTYRWNSEAQSTCDAWEFRDAVKQANAAEDAGETEKELSLRRKACALYTGEFLQAFGSEDWVVLEAIPLKRDYTENLKRLCVLLDGQKAYREIVELCSMAESIYPYEEWWLTRIDALMAMNQYSEALQIYQEFTDKYFKELGLSPTEEMVLRYRKIRGMTQHPCSTVDEIYWDLTEEPALMGGAYVNYSNFVDRFRYLQRITERSGESNYLVVATMLRRSGKPIGDQGDNHWVDDIMREVLRESLRRADSFTKYNASQYLLLLVGIDLESVRIVTKRIDQKLLQAIGSGKLIFQYRALPMRQTNMDEQPLGWDFVENETGGITHD